MKRWLLVPLLLILGACSAHEPGPGERIGRALDEMRKGFDELAPAETPEERREREDREWRRRQDEYYRNHPDSGRYDSTRNTGQSADIYRDRPLTDEEQAAHDEREREYWRKDSPRRDEDDHY